MKKLIIATVAMATLSGCVVPYESQGRAATHRRTMEVFQPEQYKKFARFVYLSRACSVNGSGFDAQVGVEAIVAAKQVYNRRYLFIERDLESAVRSYGRKHGQPTVQECREHEYDSIMALAEAKSILSNY